MRTLGICAFLPSAVLLATVTLQCGCGTPGTNAPTIPTTNEHVTCVVPHMEEVIQDGVNYLYCPTFQMAWSEAQTNVVKGPILLSGNPPLAEVLNRSSYGTDNLESNSFLIAGGYLKDNVLQETRERFVTQFGHYAPVLHTLRDRIRVTDLDFITFAYIEAFLRFREPFHSFLYPLRFASQGDTTKVRAFGISNFSSETSRDGARRRQVRVDYYDGEDDFVVTLEAYSRSQTNSEPLSLSEDEPGPKPEAQSSSVHQIVLAKIQPARTLKETWNAVRIRMVSKESIRQGDHLIRTEILKIPRVECEEERHYDELIGRRVMSRGFEMLNIVEALQCIKFEMNERGADLRSHGFSLFAGAGGYMQLPRRFVLDKPFLVALRKKDKEPYLILWIANPSFLVADSDDPARGTPYEDGRSECMADIRRGRLVWKVASETDNSSEKLRQQIRLESFGVRTETVAGRTGESLDAYIEGYNGQTLGIMQREHGKDVLERLERDTELYCHSAAGGAMAWLLENQNEDGSWGAAKDTKPALTALVLLAFSSFGESGNSVRYSCLKKAENYLVNLLGARKRVRKASGLSSEAIIATACLEAYRLSKGPALKTAAEQALATLLAGSEQPTFWDVLALRAAIVAGFDNPETKARAQVVVQRPEHARQMSDAKDKARSHVAHLLGMMLLENKRPPESDLELLEGYSGFDWENPQGAWPMDEWYVHTLACLLVGGETWKSWNKTFAVGLVNARGLKGTWEHPGTATAAHKMLCDADRRVYTNSMAVLMLNVYYRYLSFCHSGLPASQEPAGAE